MPAEKSSEQIKSLQLAAADVVRFEFLIDDLIQQLAKDPASARPVASCNGCSSCSVVADPTESIKGR